MTRKRWSIFASLIALAAATTLVIRPRPLLIWNVSASVPIGFYAIESAGQLHVTELVAVDPPPELASFLAERRYLPRGVPMLKRILALPGQIVCRAGRTVSVDGIAMGEALDSDSQRRPLPVWQGCQRVPTDSIFLMNRGSAHSFDGRYFGLLPASTIVGRAVPLWTHEED
ncbi:S26 family signal peptidase [Acidisphaera rubrifaciens]|uniref:Conjugal transfer protein TraF n=1 Tax=Acidisphaera rubrifaciens HS-AP3 TaxID=1231350 RepID=A0A0D6P3A5_9PROT|nr:S26 family signal peptidase [Acidisphaera rubrifaciens]GAN75821.1 conjugal transfer protein TraF [Acidisphaera rubrifaciens HS-AP3]